MSKASVTERFPPNGKTLHSQIGSEKLYFIFIPVMKAILEKGDKRRRRGRASNEIRIVALLNAYLECCTANLKEGYLVL